MRTAKVVIGAAWGDEGKGLVTDAFADNATLVVRFNGGAQAGHTVVAPDGRRHVFHHIGSGSFRGAKTYLSRYFLSNPLFFFTEVEELKSLGVTPQVLADPLGLVTTPYDMMLNQMIEESRGNARHGSCGLGINETVTRHQTSGIPSLRVGDLSKPGFVENTLHDIRKLWVPRRLAALELEPDASWQARLDSGAVLEAFSAMARLYVGTVTVTDDGIRSHHGSVLFEGAQGLLLDERHRWFPHVTRSRTGLTNVEILAREAGIEALDLTYVTRAYATRHGAGPFPREVAGLHYDDWTNVPNIWQQTLRFGLLDLDLLAETIGEDLSHANLPVQHSLAFTCLDQVGDRVRFWLGETQHCMSPESLVKTACEKIGGNSLLSYGPTRETFNIKEIQSRAILDHSCQNGL
jgi:adenylosuccinate synthase